MSIVSNKIKCLQCGDVVESTHQHDFRYCACGNVAVDGGTAYLKRSFSGKTPEESYVELSEVVDDSSS